MILKKHFFIFILCSLLIACSSINPLKVSLKTRIDVKKLAMDLDNSLNKLVLKNKETAILSIVDLRDFKKTNSIARYIQQQLYHYLFHLGFRLIDLRVTREITFVPLKGEFNFSRLKESLKQSNIEGIKSVIIGTYTEIGHEVFYNISMIEIEGNVLRASSKIKMKSIKKAKEVKLAEGEVIERPVALTK